MRVLLDECVPRKFKFHLVGHACSTVPEAGFAGSKNGELLALAEREGFEIFVTLDKGLAYQQSLRGRQLAVIVLRTSSNRLADVLVLTEKCLAAAAIAKPGTITFVG